MNNKGYIFVEPQHPIVENVILERFMKKEAKLDPLDVKVSDFDDCSYQLKVDRDSTEMEINMVFPHLKDLKPLGANRVLQRTYGSLMKSSPAKNFDLSLVVDKASHKDENSIREVAKLISLIKRNLWAAPLEDAFDSLLAGTSSKFKPMVVNTRKNEQMIIQAAPDRVIVCFSLAFEEETDAALADIIMQELSECQRQIGSAPACNYERDIPGQLKKIKGIKCYSTTVGFVQFAILKSHIHNGLRDSVCLFRHYVFS